MRGLDTVAGMLDGSDVDRFMADGYVALRGVVPADVIAACWAEVAAVLRARGVDIDDPSTWTAAVVRISCPESAAFAAAGTQPVLWDAYDWLLGARTWWRRRGVGGTIPVRFPHADDPGDAGWHIDGSFAVDGDYWVNVRSSERGLLCLFLLTDVGPADVPTELKVGSHLDLPEILAPAGDRGMSFVAASQRLPASTFARPSTFATGRAGDVFVCHPFLVHRATWPHTGTRPRAVAQPGVALLRPFALDQPPSCPVEGAIVGAIPSGYVGPKRSTRTRSTGTPAATTQSLAALANADDPQI